MSHFELNINLIFAAVAAVAVIAVSATLYLAYLRRKALEELAVSRGMKFSKEGFQSGDLSGTGLAVFMRGNGRRSGNMLSGAGSGGAKSLSFFDYSYTTGRGRNRSTQSLTLALADFGEPRLPAFELKPEGLLYKLGEMLGFKDIDIESAPEFSAKYRLTGPSEPEVRAFFGPATVMCFERHQGLNVQGGGRYMAIYRRAGRLPAAEYAGFIDEVKEILSEMGR